MVRALICLFCLAVALGLTSNRRRAERDAARALATLEMAYDLPRLGEAREPVLDRLRITKEWTTAGTQLGLLATAAAVWFLPVAAGIDPFVLAGLVWFGGQQGRALGSVRGARPGTPRHWRNVVPLWLLAPWGLVAGLLVGFLVFCFTRDGGIDVGAWSVAGAALVGLVSWWLSRIALAAGSFLPTPVPAAWHEALRGDAVRAAQVLAPGAVAIAVPSLVGLAATAVPNRFPGDPTWLLTCSVLGLLLFAVTMFLGWLAVRWHSREVRALVGSWRDDIDAV